MISIWPMTRCQISRQTGGQLEFDEKGQQAADQLEMLNVFGKIAIKRVFLRPKTKGKCS